MEAVDFVLFAGWFVGVRPIEAAVFETTTLAPIDTLGDSEALLRSRSVSQRSADRKQSKPSHRKLTNPKTVAHGLNS